MSHCYSARSPARLAKPYPLPSTILVNEVHAGGPDRTDNPLGSLATAAERAIQSFEAFDRWNRHFSSSRQIVLRPAQQRTSGFNLPN